MRRMLAAGLIAALAAVTAPVGADAPKTMGEAAAQTKKKKPAKVYTEDDLHNHGRSGTYSQPAADGSAPSTTASPAAGDKKPAASPSEKPKTEEEVRADEEKEWRGKLTQAQADVTTWTGEVARLQAILNDNTGPQYGLTASTGRGANVAALDNAKRQLAAAQQTVETLQNEGRSKGYR